MARIPALTSSETLATSLYDQLRRDLLGGVHEPGSKLGIELLCERYASSQTPIREALNRLTADGLVQRREQRGFAVAQISIADLEEITRTRCWLEEIALRESIARHTSGWEEAVVIAHHRLTRVPRSLREDRFEDNPQWEPLHRAFHRALIGGCGSRWLLSFCEQLADQHHRYRRLSAPRAFHKRGVKGEHQALLDASLAGDADGAVALVQAHFRRTATIILQDRTLFKSESATGRTRMHPLGQVPPVSESHPGLVDSGNQTVRSDPRGLGRGRA